MPSNPLPSEPLAAIELFSGGGGLSLGLKSAGFQVAAAVEQDASIAEVYRRNFGGGTALIEADVRQLSGDDLRGNCRLAEAAQIALVAGGPPCQGFSTGGKHVAGDERNLLIFEFARLVAELGPKAFLMENVPGLLSTKHEKVLAKYMRHLTRAGYVVLSPVKVNSANFGVPQDRSRIFIAGFRHDVHSPQASRIFLESLQQGRHIAVGEALGIRTRDYEPDESRAKYYAAQLHALEKCLSHDPSVTHTDASTVIPQHSMIVRERFRRTQPGEREPVSRFQRLSLEGLSPTLRSGTGPERGSFTPPRPIHPISARVLTVREAARLHSFPDTFRFADSQWHSWRAIGNAVPPLLASAVASGVRSALEWTRTAHGDRTAR